MSDWFVTPTQHTGSISRQDKDFIRERTRARETQRERHTHTHTDGETETDRQTETVTDNRDRKTEKRCTLSVLP